MRHHSWSHLRQRTCEAEMSLPSGSSQPSTSVRKTILYAPSAAGHGQVRAFKVIAPAEIPTVFWSTGWNFLGAYIGRAVRDRFGGSDFGESQENLGAGLELAFWSLLAATLLANSIPCSLASRARSS